MASNPYGAYLETQVLCASPLQLVRLAYEGAIKAITDAREHLVAGRIFERGRAIAKAINLITELSRGLDVERGGNVSLQLARLYDYMQRRLMEAHVKQLDEPMAEVQQLLESICEAWKQVAETENATAAVAASSSPWINADRPVYSPANYTL